MALRDLVNPITQAYSKSATGFDYGEVRDALKQDRDYKRQQIKSFYDITADLDAAAYSAIKSEIDQVSEKIDKNKLKVNTPEFQQIMGRVRATATGLKETQDLVKKVSQEYAKDPNKFAYISGEQGLEVDEGFEGFMRRMSEASSKKYETPEEYIQGLTSEIGRVQNRVDERLFSHDVQKILADEINLAKQAVSMQDAKDQKTGRVPTLKVGNREYVEVPIPIVEAIQRSQQKVKQLFPNAVTQVSAKQRASGNELALGSTNEEYFDNVIAEMMPSDLLKEYEITRREFAPKTEKGEKKLTKEGSGYRFGDYYYDVKSIQFPALTGGNVGQTIRVENDKVNPQQDLIDGRGRPIRGSISEIKMENGELMINVRVGAKSKLIPYDDNEFILSTEYGLTRRDIEMMMNQRSVGEQGSMRANSQSTITPSKKAEGL
jgi:deoxyhypusine synthase